MQELVFLLSGLQLLNPAKGILGMLADRLADLRSGLQQTEGSIEGVLRSSRHFVHVVQLHLRGLDDLIPRSLHPRCGAERLLELVDSFVADVHSGILRGLSEGVDVLAGLGGEFEHLARRPR